MLNGTSPADMSKDSFEDAYVQEHLAKIAKNAHISNPKYVISMGTKKGDNFLGVIYRVIIEGERNGEIVKLSTIFKCSPQCELQRRLMKTAKLFIREIYFYQQVVPVFSKLLQEKNLILNDIPICYGGSDENLKEVIILEDLKDKGFVMSDRVKGLDYPHASMALRHLGRFHAYSFALRDQNPDVFQKLSDLEDPFFKSNTIETAFDEHTKILASHVVFALAEQKPHYVERFLVFFDNFRDEMANCCDSALAEPYTVINHGDFWTNNMMFRYNEKSEPQDFFFLDFQLVRYCSPALDLVYMLFCCCNQELRSNLYNQLLHDYHNSLSECLVQLDSDPERLFPFTALIDQLNNFGKFGAGMAMLTIHIFTAEKENVTDINDFGDHLQKLKERVHTDDHYRNTLRDAFKDLIDRHYI